MAYKPTSVKDAYCPTCWELFDHPNIPRLLECGHTFCELCIRKYWTEIIKCPSCLKTQQMPNTGVSGLLVDQGLQSLAHELKKSLKLGDENDSDSDEELSILVVETLQNQKWKIHGLDPATTIRDLKCKIENLAGILPQHQRLVYLGKPLLDDFHVRVIRLVGPDFKIYGITGSTTIRILKEKIADVISYGCTSEQLLLYFDGGELDDGKTLQDEGICKGCCVQLIEMQMGGGGGPDLVELIVYDTNTRDTYQYKVKSDETFGYLKQLITDKIGISVGRQHLFRNNEELLDAVEIYFGGGCNDTINLRY